MRILNIGRSIYRTLLPDERRKFRTVLLMSLFAAVLEAIGATLVFGLLARFTSTGESSRWDGLFSGYSSEDITIVLGSLTLAYALLRMSFSLIENHLQVRRIQQFAGSLSARVLEQY